MCLWWGLRPRRRTHVIRTNQLSTAFIHHHLEHLAVSLCNTTYAAHALRVTTQYTALNFPVKNLWEQFHRPANVYFLGISILQCIKAISITGGTPTTLAPLTAVLLVSGQQHPSFSSNLQAVERRARL